MMVRNHFRSPTVNIAIEKVARLVQLFSRQEKARLLQLVPELQTIHPEEANLPLEQVELMNFFEKELDRFGEAPRLAEDDIFLSGLTVAEFFTLPEREQGRLWDKAHVDAEQILNIDEQPVPRNALPAR